MTIIINKETEACWGQSVLHKVTGTKFTQKKTEQNGNRKQKMSQKFLFVYSINESDVGLPDTLYFTTAVSVTCDAHTLFDHQSMQSECFLISMSNV